MHLALQSLDLAGRTAQLTGSQHQGDGVPSWQAGASWKLGGGCYLKGSEDIGAWIEDGLASQTVAPPPCAILRA